MQTYAKISLVLSLMFCAALFTGCGEDSSSENDSDVDPSDTVGVEDERLEPLDIDTISQCTEAQRNEQLKGKWWAVDQGVNQKRCTTIPRLIESRRHDITYNRIRRHINKKTETQGLCILDRKVRGGYDWICIVDL